MSLGLDLAELSRHLKQERLFVSSEREQLQKLHEEVKTVAEQLYHESWVARKQKTYLDLLLVSSQEEVTPAECCAKTNQLESTTFVDGYKHLSYHDSKYGDFLKFLRDNPQMLGQILYCAEKGSIDLTQNTIRVIVASLFGNCVLQEDEIQALKCLKCLIDLQVAPNDNPRRLIRKGSCTFNILFRNVFDSLFSAKLFLTAALHDPVMRLLMEDEWFYDIDPGKALVRFPPNERKRRFGEPGTEEYKTKLQNYRKTIVDKLVTMATRFIVSLKNNMHCFPPSLGWIISQVYQALTKTDKMSPAEVRALCADLVFALFICPAICDPEPHGITTDVPISHIARHNLMQMAQIIQVLAISQSEDIDPKLQDLYGRFEKGCMSSLLDSLLDGIGPELPSTNNSQLPCTARTSVLITLSELNDLLKFLNGTLAQLEDVTEKKQLEELLHSLPNIPLTPTPTGTPVTPGTPVLGHRTPGHTPPGTPQSHKKHKSKKKSAVSMMSPASEETQSPLAQLDIQDIQPVPQNEDVLVVSLGMENDCPGMMSEHKVLSWEQENRRRRVKYHGVPSYDVGVGTTEIQEKRTRFSLSHDQESIGNTSDIQEAISEAASSHSVGSVDLEDNDADNFSDMISANVSGRGTPNISGRDTPLSQAESVEEDHPPNLHVHASLPETVQKTNREDVTDRFGKFEIKPELEIDEIKSTVSDTWSTDVLASDSEPPEQNQQVRLEEIAEEMVRQHLLTTHERVSEISETASDAWSTDVLASDTEEKQMEVLSEFDQDDSQSVTELSGNLEDMGADEEHGDLNEETPLASGGPSPTEDLPELSGTVGRGPQPIKTKAVYPLKKGRSEPPPAGVSPPLSDNVFMDTNNDPPIANSQNYDSSKLFVPVQGRKQELFPAPSHKGKSNCLRRGESLFNSNNRDRFSDSSVQATRSDRTREYLLRNSAPVQARGQVRVGSDEIRVEEVKQCSMDSLVAQQVPHFGPDAGVRPKVLPQTNNSVTRPLNGDIKFGAPLPNSVPNRRHVAGRELSKEVSSSRSSNDSGVSSLQKMDMEILSEQVDGINLTEQQNTNIDESRFSSALSMFDPLAEDGEAAGDLLEGAGSPVMKNFQEMLSPPPTAAQTGPSGQVPNHVVPSTNGNKDPKENNQSKAQFDFSLTAEPQRAERQNTAPPVNGSFLQAETPPIKRRSSTDSQSSGSSMSKDGSGSGEKSDRSSLDNTSQNLEDKDEGAQEEAGEGSGVKKKGFLKSLREKVHKGIKKKGMKHERDYQGDVVFDDPNRPKAGGGEPNIIVTETSDDILDKYRTKSKSILTVNPGPDTLAPAGPEKGRRLTLKEQEVETTPLYDPNNVENCLAFGDAKRKLRMVLSYGDFQIGHGMFGPNFSAISNSPRDIDILRRETNDLVNLLRVQLSEAINLQNKDTVAQLHEALRCVRIFDAEGCKKLVRSLQEDYQSRSSYVAYLVRCRQGLLMTLSHVQRMLNRIQREKEICNKHMTSVCVRIFLEGRERNVLGFISEFQKLTVSDEKTDLVERFLQYLYQQMALDDIWKGANEDQLEDARLAIERYLMSRVYTHAMFPNGDGDILRDQVIQQHIKKLSTLISPAHKDLRIPRMYHLECPWPAAQREIYMINAYKTPKDKLQCVLRCSSTIMNLLSMANEESVPAADDFVPVLIFVIIKANPPCLLSTIQYVNSFYDKRLAGEEQYWWMQFCAAVEFIKTMEYSE